MSRKQVSEEEGPSKTSKKHHWTLMADERLLDLLIEHVNNGTGRFTDGRIRKEVYNDILRRFNESIGSNITRVNIDSRMKTLRKKYKDWTKIKNQSGWGWDNKKGCAIVEKDVWNEFVQNNVWAKQYEGRNFPLYDKLSIIVGTTMTVELESEDIEELHNNMSENLDNLNGSPFVIRPTLEEENPNGKSVGIDDVPEDMTEPSTLRTCRTSRHKRRARPHAESQEVMADFVKKLLKAMVQFVSQMSQFEEKMLNAFKQSNKRREKIIEDTKLDDAYEALAELRGIDEMTLWKGMELLESAEKRKQFLFLSSDRRLDWLKWKLGRSS